MIGVARKALARELLVEVRRHDRDLEKLAGKIRDAVKASGTTVTDVHGVGPIANRLARLLLDINAPIDVLHCTPIARGRPAKASDAVQIRDAPSPRSSRVHHLVQLSPRAVPQAGH